jgi:FkbM family methyltransferase
MLQRIPVALKSGILPDMNIFSVYFRKIVYFWRRFRLLLLISKLSGSSHLYHCIKLLLNSPSQLNQDLFVLSLTKFKRSGFFVEVGATDGKFLSNTISLEKNGWGGILFEPCKSWHPILTNNRSCQLDYRAVSDADNLKVLFSETSRPELSTIASMKPNDDWFQDRLTSKDYLVDTVTLANALVEYSAPKIIDYLSIDTEGSEYEVLLGCDFERTTFNAITIEIAEDQFKRDLIFGLLSENGYVRIFSGHTFWEDWYVHQSLIK